MLVRELLDGEQGRRSFLTEYEKEEEEEGKEEVGEQKGKEEEEGQPEPK
jgi:hypothetical protein